MDVLKHIESKKSDYDDLEGFLRKNDLLDEKMIWFAGYGDKSRDGRNAATANLFYKLKNLQMVSVKDDVIYFLKHRKNEFLVSVVGKVEEKYRVKIWRNLIYPSIEIIREDGEIVHLQATKNKKCVHDFKKLVK
jgi:aspartyl-tRNA synthetase